jgi:Tfp pilus assembly protein PilF
MLGRGLAASGDDKTALAEFKESVALDPKRSQAMLGWAELLEKRGDWANAMERYHQAAALETAWEREDHHGQPFLSSTVAQTAYRSAQARLEEHIKELKAAGKTEDESRPRAADACSGVGGGQHRKVAGTDALGG